jgi:hypothetical protein
VAVRQQLFRGLDDRPDTLPLTPHSPESAAPPSLWGQILYFNIVGEC